MIHDRFIWFMLLAAGIAVFVTTALGLRFFIPFLVKRSILDVPNERSSHHAPTPRGGGLVPSSVIALAGLIAGLLVGALWPVWFGLTAFFLSFMFFKDDSGTLGIRPRLFLQCVAVFVVLFFVIAEWISLPSSSGIYWIAWPIMGIFWLWFINAFNFMDGIDGISGVQAVTLGAGALCVATAADFSFLTMPVKASGIVLAAAGAGFLTMNWHPARVFLGDAGSIPLGFLAAGLMIALAVSGEIAAAFILPAYYMVDATLTLLRRLLRGEAIWRSHRLHAYQIAHQAGLAHNEICWRLIGCNAGLVVLAVVSVWHPVLAVFAGYMLAFALYLSLLFARRA
jgi:UDP-N-acetylmuramyl pentapeptide phosphotransferase/UDP-N-acetylglucosamine-1-phosphate transferase